MHKAGKSSKGFGFEVDNTIGSTPLINTWSSDWIEFYGEKRLGYQLKLARDQYGDSAIYQKGPTGVEERKARRKWTPKEDVVLISAWLNTNKDPVIGNKQKAVAFWKRIQAYFNASPQLAVMQKREASHCKQRWGRLNDQVCKFVGCYEAPMKQKSSGQNENDIIKAAHEFFFNDYQIKFTLEHAWRELRHDQKWCSAFSAIDGGRSKKRKAEECSAQSSSSQPVRDGEDVAMAHPLGVKASKAIGRRAENKTTSEENALHEF